MDDFYELLGVERDAPPEEIKRAFRRLARQYHPDVAADDPEAEGRFKAIARAYETLSDPDKRARYDRFGEAGVAANGDPFVGVGLSDLFEAFFGGDPFGVRRPSGPARGPDAEVRVELDLAEAAFGAEKTIEMRLPVECEACGASGAKPGTYPSPCDACGGAGEVRELRRSILGQIVSARTCSACRGAGKVIHSPCSECGGEGRVTRLKRLQVDVPAGIDSGQRLRLAGRGPAAPRGGFPGDLYVSVSVRVEPGFERVGDDLVRPVRIAISQAVLGATVEVDTLDGVEELVIPPGTSHGAVFRLRGRGVPHLRGGGRGDLLISVEIDIPERLSDEEVELFRRLAELRGEAVGPEHNSLLGRIRSAFQ
ncbi:MAG: molecular chaperone DnaJ [Actinobacteria bacterium]|nr:molecular chaperone DnaJ [Actinomycetota bacterium]